ncbi:CDP-diacylglycerol--glycerol-3-phosphate 3-phosphatidyltransferase [Geranomyces variabilis]|uniref:CDP-diacylglycerol--glycerol-3-phosphate 3-phosphatidyltransferase n=1 Tax=Geranomyces variabilis TaxID=109894 RepID=A0AAD5TFF0_9FUNG|nr:CDP-diacylglycerol--glycerol-3-phosphate 3-phosphatidyltransferase [Geranomyces variabilis]
MKAIPAPARPALSAHLRLRLCSTIIRRQHRACSQASTARSAYPAVLRPVFSPTTPLFPANPAHVEILAQPADFFNSLADGIAKARKRIVLASLYLGASEQRVADALRDALKRNSDLTVDILVDYFRGTRGPKSTVDLLQPLVNEFPDRFKLSLYHTPKVGSLIKKIVPPRFIEAFGLQHMKVYILDDDVMLSGANLNTDYFVDRQDRYIRFRQAGRLTEYYADLVRTVASFSYAAAPANLGQSAALRPPTPHASDPVRLDTPALKLRAAGAMRDFINRWSPQRNQESKLPPASGDASAETYVAPVLHMAQLGIRQEDKLLARIFETITPATANDRPWTVALSSGYLNFPPSILSLLPRSRASLAVLTAAPEANGFFGSKGVSRHLPAAYTHLEKGIMRLAEVMKITVSEWKKPGWTFHAKGLWCTPPGERTPVLAFIGSSNFGYRSLYRDVETQAVIVTGDEALRTALQKNLDDLWADSSVMTPEQLEANPARKVHPGVAITTRIIRTML